MTAKGPAVTVKITDAKQIEQIEALRGEKSAVEFAAMCVQAGLRMAALQKQPKKGRGGKPIAFTAAKPEFKKLDVAAITGALKNKDPKDPVTLEVNRLVGAYAAELKKFAQSNGNKLPRQLKLDGAAAIERIALKITAQAFEATAKQARAG